MIVGLKLRGIGPIVAADFEAHRRDLAIKMGADIVIDPRELSPYGPLHGLGNRRATLIYECVGKPGLLNQIMTSVGFGARIVVGGFYNWSRGSRFRPRAAHTIPWMGQ